MAPAMRPPAPVALLLLGGFLLTPGCLDEKKEETEEGPLLPKNFVLRIENEGDYTVEYWVNLTTPTQTQLLAEHDTLPQKSNLGRTVTINQEGKHAFEYKFISRGLTGAPGGSVSGSTSVDPTNCPEDPEILANFKVRSDGSILGPTGAGAGGTVTCT